MTQPRGSATTGWVWHERYGWYDTGRFAGLVPPGGWGEPDLHMENGETKRRLASLVSASGLVDSLTAITPREATDAEILTVHTADYLEYLQEQNAHPRGGIADRGIGRTVFSHGDLQIARLAAGGVIEAALAVARRDVPNAYALTRPPGHHALPDTGLGFCVLGNIAIAIHALRAQTGLQRFAVVDWDVHHGNGTQAMFWDDPDVLTISLHQDRLFPDDEGLVDERGGPAARGACLNIPLPAGSGRGAYQQAFEQIVLPALDSYAPQMVIVACGFDSSTYDPHGRMMLGSDDFRWMTRQVKQYADQHADGRLLVVHEGGYSTWYVPFCGLAVIEELSGVRTEVVDTFMERLAIKPTVALQPHQQEYIDRAAAGLRLLERGHQP